MEKETKMKKTKTPTNRDQSIKITAKQAVALGMLVLSLGSVAVGYLNSPARANNYQQQIDALRRQNDQYEAQAAELRIYAGSLSEEIAKLDAEKQVILAQIAATNQQLEQLAADIRQTEVEIEANQEVLGSVLKEMYMAGQITPLERLASSKTISDYINEEVQRENLQQALVEKVDEIEAKKKLLEGQKKETEQVLASQQAQKEDLASKEAEKVKLLNETRGEEASYKSLAAKNNQQIDQLKAAQEEEMRRAARNSGWNVPTGPMGDGGYPGAWAYAPKDSLIDSWGLYNRECVSYTAWKVWSTGRFVPHFGGRGNANQWPSTTSRYGIPNGSTPKEGSVAVWYIGRYGHVMYVEKLNGDGTMWVSDYNFYGDGTYRKYIRSTAGLTYIYF